MDKEVWDWVVSKKREYESSSSSESNSISEDFMNDLFWDSSDSDDEQPEKRCRIEGFMEKTIPRYSDEEFRSHFRLSRNAMKFIENLVKEDFQPSEGHYGGRIPISPKKAIHFFVWYLANQETFRQICDRFNIAPSTGHDIIKKVSFKFKNNIGKNFIKFPEPVSFDIFAEGFKRKKNLNHIIGAIDCSHIPIRRPRENEADFVNRKGYHSIILQGICDSERCFMDIYVGEPGSLHDARVLKKSPFYQYVQQNPGYIGNYCLLGDSAYPVLPWLVPPFKDTGALTREQNEFNYAHSATRVVIENTFGLLKGRFRRLHHFENLSKSLIINCVISACALHNMCLNFDDLDNIEYFEQDGDGGDEPVEFSENNMSNLCDKRQQLFDEFISSV